MRRTLVLVTLLATTACQTGFVEKDIDDVQDAIRTEYGKDKRVKVLDVQMMKESPRKLTGFAKMKLNVLGASVDVFKACSATMGEDNRYIWHCHD
jgi:hypothetical protein